MGAGASVSSEQVRALSTEQKQLLLKQLEAPFCKKKGVEDDALASFRDEFLKLNNGSPGSEALQTLQNEVAQSLPDELSAAFAQVQISAVDLDDAPKLSAPVDGSPT